MKQSYSNWKENSFLVFLFCILLNVIQIIPYYFGIFLGLVWVILFYKNLKQAIYERKFVILLFSLLLVAYGCLFFIPQTPVNNNEVGKSIKLLISFFHLNSISESYFFWGLHSISGLCLLFQMGKNVLTSQYVKSLFSLGGIILLTSSFLYFLKHIEGVIFLEKNEQKNIISINPRSNGFTKGQISIPFQINLKEIEESKRLDKYQLSLWKKNGGKLPKKIQTYNLFNEDKILDSAVKIKDTDYSFQIKNYIPNYKWGYTSTQPHEKTPPNDPILIAEVKTERGTSPVQLRANFEDYNQLSDPYGQSNVVFSWEIPEKYQNVIKNNTPLKTVHHLKIMNENGNIIDNISLVKEKTYPLSNPDYKVKFIKFYDHLLYSEEKEVYFNGSNFGENPAIKLRLIGREQPEFSFYLYSDFQEDDSRELQQVKTLTGLNFQYDYDNGNCILVVGATKMVYYINKNEVKSESLKLNAPYLFNGRLDGYFTISNLFPDAKYIQPQPVLVNDNPIHPMVELALMKQSSPNDKKTHLLTLSNKLNDSENNQFISEQLILINNQYFLTLEENDESIKDIMIKLEFSTSKTTSNTSNAPIDKAKTVQIANKTIKEDENITFNGYSIKIDKYNSKTPNQVSIQVKNQTNEQYLLYLGLILCFMAIILEFNNKNK